MALTKPVKNTLDFALPSLVAGIVGFTIFSKKKDWKFVLIGTGIAFLLSYIIVSQVTKAFYTNGPAALPTGGGCENYDPTALIDAIYEDCTCTACFRDKELYTTLLGLSDCQLITAYNYWNKNKFASAGSVSLPIMIAQQGNFWDSDFEQQQQALSAKFKTLSLQ